MIRKKRERSPSRTPESAEAPRTRVKYECPDCSWTSHGKTHFEIHTRTHTMEKPFKCEQEGCQSAFNSKGNLNHHCRTVHEGQRRYKCDYANCLYTSNNKYTFEIHTRTHTMEKPFECDQEGREREFGSTSAVDDHHDQAVHKNRKQFTCEWEDCKHTSTTKDSLIIHYRTHTKEKPYKCEWEGCKYTAARKADVRSHYQAVHLKRRPRKCEWEGCGHAASTKSDLKQHERRHTQPRSHKCEWEGCNYAGNKKEHLKKHIEAKHTKQKPFKCREEGCQFASASSEDLTYHYRVRHSGGRACNHCRRTYGTLSDKEFEDHIKICRQQLWSRKFALRDDPNTCSQARWTYAATCTDPPAASSQFCAYHLAYRMRKGAEQHNTSE